MKEMLQEALEKAATLNEKQEHIEAAEVLRKAIGQCDHQADEATARLVKRLEGEEQRQLNRAEKLRRYLET